MRPTLRTAQTSHDLLAATSVVCRYGLPQTWKTLSGVKVEVPRVDEARQTEEVLQHRQLAGWVGDQTLAVHKVQLIEWKSSQPAAKMAGVDADLDGPPRCRDLTTVN